MINASELKTVTEKNNTVVILAPSNNTTTIKDMFLNKAIKNNFFSLNELELELKLQLGKLGKALLSNNEKVCHEYISSLLHSLIKCLINLLNEKHYKEMIAFSAAIIEHIIIVARHRPNIPGLNFNEEKLYTLLSALFVIYDDKNFGLNIMQEAPPSFIGKLIRDNFIKLHLTTVNELLKNEKSKNELLQVQLHLIYGLREYQLALNAFNSLPKPLKNSLSTKKKELKDKLTQVNKRISELSNIEIDLDTFSELIELYISAGLYREANMQLKTLSGIKENPAKNKLLIFSHYIFNKIDNKEQTEISLSRIQDPSSLLILNSIYALNLNNDILSKKWLVLKKLKTLDSNNPLGNLIQICLNDLKITTDIAKTFKKNDKVYSPVYSMNLIANGFENKNKEEHDRIKKSTPIIFSAYQPHILNATIAGPSFTPNFSCALFKKLNILSQFIVNRLIRQGHEVWLTGGALRDLFMGREEPNDFDFVTTAKLSSLHELFSHFAKISGHKQQTLTIFFENQRCDISSLDLTLNKSIKDSINRSIINEALKENSNQRDFTINALYWDFKTAMLIDFHNGLKDIEQKIIRLIGKPASYLGVFQKNPILLMRALRFSILLEFKFDRPLEVILGLPSTKELIYCLQQEALLKEFNKFLALFGETNTLILLEKNGFLENIRKRFAHAKENESKRLVAQ